jgi:tetratricopeptide (TPR) repeat protein
LLDSGQKAAALKLVEGEVPKHRHASPLLILAAELRTSSGDIGGGVKYYEQLFDSGYRDDEVFRTFVLNAIEVRQWRVAETALQKYAMGHDSPRISMLKGFLAQMQGRYSEAIVAYRAHLARHPDDPEVLQLLAVCAIRVNRFADSITICNKLIAARQVNAGVYRTLGYAHSGLQEWAEAKTAFQRSLEMEPENAQAREMMHLLEQK